VENVFFHVADAEAGWPYADGTFDRVLALDILEHIVARRSFLDECRRVLKADGMLLVAVPNRETSWRKGLRRMGLPSFSDPDHKVEYTREELAHELRASGFAVERILPVVYDAPWYGLIDALGGISLSLYRRLASWKRRMAQKHPAESNGFRVVARPS
jgi:SAM-dependent methyltransferase